MEEIGLTTVEATERLQRFGPNVLCKKRRFEGLVELLRMLADPMAVMLASAGVIYLLLGEIRDGVIVLVALVPVVGIDVFLEARSRQALKKLSERLAPTATVIRDGKRQQVPSETLVPGDVLVIGEGDVLHADGKLSRVQNLTVDESQLTGESEPLRKRVLAPGEADSDEDRFFAGSIVLAGQGQGTLSHTGQATRFGKIAKLVDETAEEQTPLQRKIRRLVLRLALIAVVVAVGVFTLSMVRGESLARALVGGISLAMAAIPEEFPLVFALFLSLGAFRLSRRGVLVRRLVSVETLGSTTVICADKTGTLTAGSFILDSHAAFEERFSEKQMLERAVLACEPDPQDTMDRAIIEHCATHGVDAKALHAGWELCYDYDFDPLGKHMSHVWRERGGSRWRIVAKGAVEGILEHCALAPGERERVEAANEALSRAGMRVLALAARDPASSTGRREADEKDLTFVGLLGFRDPIRAEVPAAVRECVTAGIRVKMITGDHALTAHAIGQQAGLCRDADGVVTGAELDALDPAAFTARVKQAVIFARIRPEQKFAIVEALRQSGEVVAMTGDGINDAPALRRADIGISMGKRGTEVARAAADLVLLDDDFASIVTTVREGRHIFHNIRAAFYYLLAFHVPIIGAALIVPLLGLPLLLLPVHIIWLELIVHPVSALIFEGKPLPPDLMRVPPRDPKDPLLARRQTLWSLLTGVLMTAAVIGLYWAFQNRGVTYARSVALTALIAASLLLVLAELAGTRPWWKLQLPRARRFWPVWLTVAASLVVAATVPPVARMLAIEPFGEARQWALVAAAAVLSVAWRFFGLGRSG